MTSSTNNNTDNSTVSTPAPEPNTTPEPTTAPEPAPEPTAKPEEKPADAPASAETKPKNNTVTVKKTIKCFAEELDKTAPHFNLYDFNLHEESNFWTFANAVDYSRLDAEGAIALMRAVDNTGLSNERKDTIKDRARNIIARALDAARRPAIKLGPVYATTPLGHAGIEIGFQTTENGQIKHTGAGIYIRCGHILDRGVAPLKDVNLPNL